MGFGNFRILFGDKFYRSSFVTTATFSILVTSVFDDPGAVLAVLADRLIKGSGVYRTLADLALCCCPGSGRRAVAVHVQHPRGRCVVVSGHLGYDWNHVLNGGEAMGLVVVASAWGRISYNFLFFFAALQAVPQIGDRGGGH